jgi:hypothetical protein
VAHEVTPDTKDSMSFHVPEQHRIRTGRMASDASLGNNGGFFVPNRTARGRGDAPLRVIASDGQLVPDESPDLAGWEHVSVSLPNRCPSWEEMAYIKSVFWDADDCVVQFHPPESEYVNNHPFCLHLWRRIDGPFPMPPSILVGFASIGSIL